MPSTDDPPAAAEADAARDRVVRDAYEAWEACYAELAFLRPAYDADMLLYARGEQPDPAALRARIKGHQVDCDELFFRLLKAAEVRMRERYI